MPLVYLECREGAVNLRDGRLRLRQRQVYAQAVDADSDLDLMCRQCHAHVAGAAEGGVCPACGGELVLPPGLDSDSSVITAPDVDHRGIVLPRRHAVGGVITPR